MSVGALQSFLLYSLAVNYAILLLWFGAFALGHDALYRLHSRWFKLTIETFDVVHYSAMAAFKLGIMLLNLSPLLALLLLKPA